jgi:hypothetical protein
MFERNRLRRLIFLAVIVFFGLFSRHHPVGHFVWDKSLGDLCYAAAVFLVLRIVLPWRLRVVTICAILVCLGVELFKLTGVPSRWGGNPVLRVIFGTTFSFHNLACYVVAILIMTMIERLAVSYAAPSQARQD